MHWVSLHSCFCLTNLVIARLKLLAMTSKNDDKSIQESCVKASCRILHKYISTPLYTLHLYPFAASSINARVDGKRTNLV